jgi:SAM-dependent methyltransferase
LFLKLLPVGCGNGQLLFLLAQGGYSVDCLTGVDYSASSIELTSQIARSKGIEGLRLEVRDVLRETIEPPHRTRTSGSKGWDLITDKGVKNIPLLFPQIYTENLISSTIIILICVFFR